MNEPKSFPTENDILEALRSLGDSASLIAVSLQEQGIKGIRGSCGYCPLACFLKEKGYPAYVDGYTIYMVDGAGGILVSLRTPYEAKIFISRFDGGDFPELIKR